MADYELHNRSSVLCDSPQRINFHVKSGDYFAYLATKLGFLEEALVSGIAAMTKEESARLTKELRTDLRYVQANYVIFPRQLGDIESIPAKGNILRPDR